MLNKEYVERYKEQTGRDLNKDTNEAYSDFYHLSNKLESLGINNLQTQLNLWHRGLTVKAIETAETLNKTKYELLEWIAGNLKSNIVKEMPLVEAGIISYNDED
jgi:hypothetical protein